MTLGNKISTTAPKGYDQKLWESIPSVKAQLHPGKHDVYIYGQSSADGMACIGCGWQISNLLSRPDAIVLHDNSKGLKHDCSNWIPNRDNECPCGKIKGATNPGSMALREFQRKLQNEYALDISSAQTLLNQIHQLLIRDAEILEME